MYPVVTAQRMREIDQQAITEWGITGTVLMENAGRTVVDAIARFLPDFVQKRFLVICGKGNNGGDGLVITRHLLNRGSQVTTLLLGRIADLKGDARTNAEILLKANHPIVEVTDTEQLAQFFTGHQVIVDAIFGTGLSAPPTGIFAEAINLINESSALVISVDIPSGVDADTGKILGLAVRAHLTVTMGLPKLGSLLYPGKIYTGKLEIADIGIPKNLIQKKADTFLVDDEFVRHNLPQRPPDGHKGTFGTALLICGSRGYSGAGILAAAAAVRSGAGLVRIAYPASLSPIIEALLIEPVKHPMPETLDSTLSTEAFEPILKLTRNAEAVGIGPGISTHIQTRELTLRLLTQLDRPVVLDADGINNLAGNTELLKTVSSSIILTPHPGELSRLINTPPAEINSNRIDITRNFAREYKCVLLLKGAPTVIAAPDGKLFINPTGNSGLGSGGTGDVLTGLITGLLAQGCEPLTAAICGAYLHGRAADLGAAQLTEYCLNAGDLLKFLPAAFRSVLNAT